ncbi:MAG: hypothetical protein GTO41_15250, partial [Burkholderiales bacterium]|nr:hypothetical protein [Burkholderiales bacterium]
LPAPRDTPDYTHTTWVRGEADAIALKLRYSDRDVHARCTPRDPVARRL